MIQKETLLSPYYSLSHSVPQARSIQMKITGSAAGPKLHQKKTEHIQQKEELAEQLIKTYRLGAYLPVMF